MTRAQEWRLELRQLLDVIFGPRTPQQHTSASVNRDAQSLPRREKKALRPQRLADIKKGNTR